MTWIDPPLSAVRDVVARAIFRTMERTQHPNVYLDLSHLAAKLVEFRTRQSDAVKKAELPKP